MQIQIKLKMKDRTLIAKLVGELDHHNAKNVKEMLENAMQSRVAQNLIFDFTRLSFMDSSGVGLIIGRFKLIHALGGQVGIVCTDKTVCRLIRMSGIERLMAIHGTVEEAMEAMGGEK